MPLSGVGVVATIICEEPVTVDYRDGLYYLFDPSLTVVRAMRPAAFLRSFESAAKAIQACHGAEMPEAEVIPLRAAH